MASDKKCGCDHRSSSHDYFNAMADYELAKAVGDAIHSSIEDAVDKSNEKRELKREQLRRDGKNPVIVLSGKDIIAIIIAVLVILFFIFLTGG